MDDVTTDDVIPLLVLFVIAVVTRSLTKKSEIVDAMPSQTDERFGIFRILIIISVCTKI